MADCIFCKIAAGEVPADLLHQDDLVVAFRDVHPQAPVHVLVIPRAHWAGLDQVPADQGEVLGHLLTTCRSLAARLHLAAGYRLVLNTGADGGQSVGHLHVHLLGGRPLTWPPG